MIIFAKITNNIYNSYTPRNVFIIFHFCDTLPGSPL